MFFLSYVHDLKNSLSTLLLLADRLPTEGEGAMVKGRMEPYLRGMVRELESALACGIFLHGGYTPKYLPTCLEALLVRVAEDQRTYAELKGVKLKVEPGEPGMMVEADVRLLEEALRNMVNNAIKFSSAGGAVTLLLNATAEDRAEIRVRDEGPGLLAQDLARVFRPFARLSALPTAGESSTGLGLSLAVEMIRLHGGRVWVDAPEGRGATFGLDLPLFSQTAS